MLWLSRHRSYTSLARVYGYFLRNVATPAQPLAEAPFVHRCVWKNTKPQWLLRSDAVTLLFNVFENHGVASAVTAVAAALVNASLYAIQALQDIRRKPTATRAVVTRRKGRTNEGQARGRCLPLSSLYDRLPLVNALGKKCKLSPMRRENKNVIVLIANHHLYNFR